MTPTPKTRAELDAIELEPKLRFLNRNPKLTRQLAEELVTQGWTRIGPGEVVLNRHEMNFYQMAAEHWEAQKRAAGVSADSSDDTPGVKLEKEALILAAFTGAGKPLTTQEAIRAAAGWHPDYKPTQAEWDPWRDAWRRLLVQRRIQKDGLDRAGEFALWKTVPVEELNQDG